MFKFIGRTIGFFLLAAGFVALIADGARAVANGQFSATPLVVSVVQVFPNQASGWLQAAERQLPPMLWQWIAQPLLALPSFVVLGLLGLGLLYLARPRRARIGHAPRP